MKRSVAILLVWLLAAWAQFGTPGQAPPGGGFPAPPQGGALPPQPQLPQPGLPLATGKRYPLPAWVRPGVGFVYRDPSGNITLMMLVTDTDGVNAYGLLVSLIDVQGSPVIQVEPKPLVQNGQGLFYLNPQAVTDMVQAARAHPDPNIRVVGGGGSFAYQYKSQNGLVNFAARYDPKTGIVTELSSLMASAPGQQQQPHREGVLYRYVGYETFTWQSPPHFPPAARESHAYQIVSQIPDYVYGGNMATPTGSVEIRPLQVSPPLARFQVTVNQGGLPMNRTVFGLTGFGPHYLHPALLGRGTILQSARTGLSLSITADGLVWAMGQLPLVRTRVNPRTGLLLEETDTYPMGIQVVLRLAR